MYAKVNYTLHLSLAALILSPSGLAAPAQENPLSTDPSPQQTNRIRPMPGIHQRSVAAAIDVDADNDADTNADTPFTTVYWPFSAPTATSNSDGLPPVSAVFMSMALAVSSAPTSVSVAETPLWAPALSVPSSSTTSSATHLSTATDPLPSTGSPVRKYAAHNAIIVVASVTGISIMLILCVVIYKAMSKNEMRDCGRARERQENARLGKHVVPGWMSFEWDSKQEQECVLDIRPERHGDKHNSPRLVDTLQVPPPAKRPSSQRRRSAPIVSPVQFFTLNSSSSPCPRPRSRITSAPVPGQLSTATLSTKSMADSEWDIARAYGGPRFDRARSAGAVSQDEGLWREREMSVRSCVH